MSRAHGSSAGFDEGTPPPIGSPQGAPHAEGRSSQGGPHANLGRRQLFFGAAVVAGGAVVAGCTSNEPQDVGSDTRAADAPRQQAADKPGKPVTIGFSAPAADHGWIAAIAANAQAQAAKYPDVTFAPVNPTNDITQQIAAVETLINRKVNALVILPNDGSQLTSLGTRAMQAGIPVVNLDRIFDSPLAARGSAATTTGWASARATTSARS
jgi:ribose transport system substrate-binding protein